MMQEFCSWVGEQPDATSLRPSNTRTLVTPFWAEHRFVPFLGALRGLCMPKKSKSFRNLHCLLADEGFKFFYVRLERWPEA